MRWPCLLVGGAASYGWDVSSGTRLQYRSGVPTPPRAAFTALLDDAAMFPPGNASPADALSGHLRHRAAWYADLIGPLLVPARGWDSFLAAHAAAGEPPVTVVLIGTSSLPPDVPASVTVAGFELPVSDVPLPSVPEGRRLAAELSSGPGGERVLAAVGERAAAGDPVVVKVRTGGMTRDAFPSEETLAGVLAAAVAARAPLKLTAGLHHAVRHTASDTGFEHHGFLNVLLATLQTVDGQDAGAAAVTLAIRDPAVLLSHLNEPAGVRLVAARRWFVSFGCCGVEEPVADLVDLGLLEAIAPARTEDQP